MPGPPPKDKDQRRRANAPALGEWREIHQVVLDDDQIVIPSLSELTGLRGIKLVTSYSQTARQRWEAWRRDPVTTYWTHADIHYALDTIGLYNALPEKLDMSELRLRLKAIGLSQEGKQQLRIKTMMGVGIEQGIERQVHAAEVGAADNVVSISDRRDQLGKGA